MTKIGWNFANSYNELPGLFYTYTEPTPVSDPKIVLLNEELAAALGLNAAGLRTKEGTLILAGNKSPADSKPLAQAYAGHQFGHFTMLGDGRALLIGEQITPQGQRYDLQLKGAGPTPFSRSGDGRATLGPMLREYIISEAMHALKIPTTRGLAVVTTGEAVRREENLPGAILTRAAKSHLRVGTFQYAAAWGSKKDLTALADYAINRHYPDLKGADKFRLFFRRVIQAQASLAAKWMLVGFIHGVMNTDNMAISGETIDYGPCAFMDTFDPTTVFSSIDQNGRYAYNRQPKITAWNLARLAEALLPLFSDDTEEAVEIAQAELARFPAYYGEFWLSGMKGKLGLKGEAPGDRQLIEDLLELMYQHEADYTNTFLDLTFAKASQEALHAAKEFQAWLERWQKRLQKNSNGKLSQEMMKRHNPALIPRNHRVEKALRRAVRSGDLSGVKNLLAVLKDPFAHSEAQKEYAKPPPPSAVPYRTFCGT
ncbi:MAG TPA: YdiU family protein [Firmicutes bacterium]|nr:YdiU family protein [Bacillota bacterium]